MDMTDLEIFIEKNKSILKNGINGGRQILEYLEELKTTQKALILACKELSYRDSSESCKHISAPRTVRYKDEFMKKAREENV